MAPKRPASSQAKQSDAAKRMRMAMQSLPSQPRAAESSAAARSSDDDEDYVGDIGMEEQDRKRAQQGRRGRLVTDLSDSEEEDEAEADEGDGGKASDDSDEDMFGGPKEEKSKPQNKAKYAEPGDISGQETDALDSPTSAKGAGEIFSEQESSGEDFLKEVDPEFELESTEEEDSSPEAEDAAMPEAGEEDWENDPDNPNRGLSKRQRAKLKKGRGYKIDEFNMKDLMKQGVFTEDGAYIENAKDPHAEQDSWLQGNYNRKAIKQARQAQLKRQQDRDHSRPEEKLSVPALKARLAEFLLHGESVMEALHRLGKASHPRTKTGSKRSKGKEVASLESNPEEDTLAAKAAEAKAELEKVTSYASILMSEHGLTAIYDETYESLVRSARRAKVVEAEWDPARQKEEAHKLDPEPDAHKNGIPSPERQYVYRYSPSYMAQSGTQQVEIFGPFSGADLLAWAQQGYFGPDQDRILLQAAPTEGSPDPNAWAAWGAQ